MAELAINPPHEDLPELLVVWGIQINYQFSNRSISREPISN
jgi:hypothetical protein